MKLSGITVEETFAEAFGMRGTRLLVTADSLAWAEVAGNSMTGFATSVIGCGVESGIERALAPEETPDGRAGVAVLLFAVSRD
ncbi:MAG TPA: formylmethanofuran--tetrahydromethanopterin N-formyltransferase, partial [Alphaproteobacteria bacterium]